MLDLTETALVVRVLPPEDWHRLAGTSLDATWRALDPEQTLVIVVEQHGDILGCWAALTTVHVEGLWIRPDLRGQTVVARALLGHMLQELRSRQVHEVLTQVTDPIIEAMCVKAGGTKVPGETWTLPLTEG